MHITVIRADENSMSQRRLSTTVLLTPRPLGLGGENGGVASVASESGRWGFARCVRSGTLPVPNNLSLKGWIRYEGLYLLFGIRDVCTTQMAVSASLFSSQRSIQNFRCFIHRFKPETPSYSCRLPHDFLRH